MSTTKGWDAPKSDKLGRCERQDDPQISDDQDTFEHDAAGGLVGIERYCRGARQGVFEK